MRPEELLAKLDHRPAHPEDYADIIPRAVAKVGEPVVTHRMKLAAENSIFQRFSTIEFENYLATGEYRDSYTNDVLFRDETVHEKVFRYSVVFERDYGDDEEYIRQMESTPFGDAVIAQVKLELEMHDVLRDKFQFSSAVLFKGDRYYVLGRIDWNKASGDLQKTLQEAYDLYGMAGAFDFVECKFPTPPWID